MRLLQNLKKFTLLVFVFGIFTQSTSVFAQGPNTPESASFEPVDATDMVNLATGDFTYVLPLLNVPSPEGGYPIALAYHAGIAMNQEASWVGLGWNINFFSFSISQECIEQCKEVFFIFFCKQFKIL